MISFYDNCFFKHNKDIMSALRLSVYLISAIFSVQIALANNANIEWEKLSIDFGEIPANQPIDAEFKFKNPGMMPIIINAVEPSCGCTVAEYPKQPIPPGGEGVIKVTFDAKMSGYFSKTITVKSNAGEGTEKLFIKGEVIK